jgi:Trypsin-like peptidase domain
MRCMIFVATAMSILLGAIGAHAQGTMSNERCKLDPHHLKGPILKRLQGTVEPESNCSASLVTVKGRAPSAAAWVLTNGHCIDRKTNRAGTPSVREAGKVLHKFPLSASFALETGNDATPRVCVEAEEIVYATMTLADIAIYRLAESYEAIERRTGVKPMMLSEAPNISPGVRVHVPSAFWQDNQTCETGEPVQKLRESIFEWGPLMRLTRACRTMGGFSGSPVVREDVGEVIGVQGTVQEGTAEPCSLDNPCEMTGDGKWVVAEKGTTYMHFVHPYYRCLDGNGEFDLMKPGCPLPKP